jgi:hypothetical protein
MSDLIYQGHIDTTTSIQALDSLSSGMAKRLSWSVSLEPPVPLIVEKELSDESI